MNTGDRRSHLISLNQMATDHSSDRTPRAKVARRSNWASDDAADTLLASILDTTAHDAAEEERRREQDLARKQREAADREAAAAQRRSDEAIAKTAAEVERRRAAHQRRTDLIRAIEGPSLEEIEAAKRTAARQEEDRRVQALLKESEDRRLEAEDRARRAREQTWSRTEAIVQTPPAPRGLPWGLVSAAAAFALAALVGIAGIAVNLHSADPPLAGTYAKVTLQPAEFGAQSVERRFVPVAVAALAEPPHNGARPSKKARVPKPKNPQTGLQPSILDGDFDWTKE
jgi:hypothetical protein